jgi:prepilin-type N-terminal cleavage/methylation domain-containing protein
MEQFQIKKQKGFTLIEIVVVLIILGVLAAIAVPNLFSWIHKSQSSEAIMNMHAIRDRLVPCLRAHSGEENLCFGNQQGCGGASGPNFCIAHWEDPSPNFQYQTSNYYCTCTTGPSCCDMASALWKQGWLVEGFQFGTGWIYISGSGDDSQSKCWGEGSFRGVCQ